MTDLGQQPDVAGFALHGDHAGEPVLGRLLERGLHDELKGTAYAIIEGVDGRAHHLVFSDLEMTGDAKPGAIVETRAYDDASGHKRLSLATRSDLTIEAQVSALGATWLDRQLLAKGSAFSGGGFGAEVREAMDRRIDHQPGFNYRASPRRRAKIRAFGAHRPLRARLSPERARDGLNCRGLDDRGARVAGRSDMEADSARLSKHRLDSFLDLPVCLGHPFGPFLAAVKLEGRPGALAEHVASPLVVVEARAKKGDFVLALSGGSTSAPSCG